MATLSLPPIDQLAITAQELVKQAAGNKPLINSLNKGILQLHMGAQPVLTAGGVLIESRTRGGVVHRYDWAFGCSCEAGQASKPCWHSAMIAIIETTQARAIPLALRLTDERAARLADDVIAVVEACAETPLERYRRACQELDELYV